MDEYGSKGNEGNGNFLGNGMKMGMDKAIRNGNKSVQNELR
jgi:hypothetical protein